MAFTQEVFDEYVKHRIGGSDPKAVLELLRLRIQLLETPEQSELVRQVRAWETERKKPAVPIAPPKRPQASPLPSDPITERLINMSGAYSKTPVTDDQVRCPNCRKPNKPTDVFCYACGEFLRRDNNMMETARFGDDASAPATDYFGVESTLILIVTGAKDAPRFRIRPQDFRHEVVIGRSDGGTMTPDIDLTPHNASELGISRLHAALQHNTRNNILSISDMKSANGSFVNGQKLYPQEVRTLRNGDELRLGRMVLRVFFEHPEPTKN